MWTGVLTEFSETAKKRKYRGNSGGHKATFYVDKEEAMLPLNQLLTIEWVENDFPIPNSDEVIKLKNVTNWWAAAELPPQQQAHMNEIVKPEKDFSPYRPDPNYAPIQEAPGFGYMDIGGRVERTMPTIKEQCVKEWVAAAIISGRVHPDNPEQIAKCKKVMEQAYDIGEIQSYPSMGNAPAGSPSQGTTHAQSAPSRASYDERNPPEAEPWNG